MCEVIKYLVKKLTCTLLSHKVELTVRKWQCNKGGVVGDAVQAARSYNIGQ